MADARNPPPLSVERYSGRWVRSATGLIVPSDFENTAPPTSTPHSDRRAAGRRWRGLVSMVSTAISIMLAIATLAVSVLVLSDQIEVNRSQRDVNQSQQGLNATQISRADERYASRVAWWISDHFDDSGLKRVTLQNRAPVPIYLVALLGAPTAVFLSPGMAGGPTAVTLPPCKILTIGLESSNPFYDTLIFSDGSSYWSRGHAGRLKVFNMDDYPWGDHDRLTVIVPEFRLTGTKLAENDNLLGLEDLGPEWNDAADCGEGA